jgi:hypothetical protein
MKINYLSILSVLVIVLGCTSKKTGSTNGFNEAASVSVSDSLPFNPLQWKVVCSMIDKNANSMSTVYGNDIAVNYARSHGQGNYPAGAQLSMVTWRQKEDAHWFGGNIPDSIQVIEHVSFELPGKRPAYTMYKGSPLRIDASINEKFSAERINYISMQKVSVIP